MTPTGYGAAALEPQINVAAMAHLVRALLGGEQRDSVWLRQHAVAAKLSEHEQAALEALRVRVCERGAAMGDQVIQGSWR